MHHWATSISNIDVHVPGPGIKSADAFSRCSKLGGDLKSVVCWRVKSPMEFSIDEQLFVGIYRAFYLNCHS